MWGGRHPAHLSRYVETCGGVTFSRPRPKPAQIRDGLWLGDGGHAKNGWLLNELGITHVVNAAEEIQKFFPAQRYYLNAPITDLINEDAASWFHLVSDEIQRVIARGGRVLVHCMMGLSRSATFVIAHLMMKEQITLGHAFADISAKRRVHPNRRFMRDLRLLEVQIFGRACTSQILSDNDEVLPDHYRESAADFVIRLRATYTDDHKIQMCGLQPGELTILEPAARSGASNDDLQARYPNCTRYH